MDGPLPKHQHDMITGFNVQAKLLKANADKMKELRLREVEIAELESSHKV